jgi:light-independent protochlorophyllide reductase subunit L
VEGAQREYLRLAERLLAGADPLAVTPMRDRDLFDFLGFD